VAITGAPEKKPSRLSVLQRAQVWTPTDVESIDFVAGPQGPGALPADAAVSCDYVKRVMTGHSPKFACRLDDGTEVKVKYGGNNGEVYGEVIGTRLLWALGFGADRMYSVSVICRGCPANLGGIARPTGEFRFAPAAIERKFDGKEWKGDGGSGWSWKELDLVSEAKGGAPRAQTDALKLLAVLMQHTDSKPEQQRLVCLDHGEDAAACEHPFLMINDVGLTFGRASFMNLNTPSAVNLKAWRETPIWHGDTGCMGNIAKSYSGTLSYPVVTDEGRAFLAGLLARLSDQQLHDLFASAQVEHRLVEPGNPKSGMATIDQWVDVFKDKRRQIAERRCGRETVIQGGQ
jgi:hypothetical protein